MCLVQGLCFAFAWPASLSALEPRASFELSPAATAPLLRNSSHGTCFTAPALALLQAGGAYLPLDPAYPDDRLSVYTEDAAVALMLTSGDLAPRATALLAAGGRADTPTLLVDAEAAASDPGNLPRSRVQPDDACYVIFTSGSTGRPKGAQQLHGGLRDLMLFMVDYYKIGECHRNNGTAVASVRGFASLYISAVWRCRQVAVLLEPCRAATICAVDAAQPALCCYVSLPSPGRPG